MQIKDLEDWSKISKRKNKKKHQWGWFQNPNAGNVEYNIDFFNHVSGADGGDTSVLAGAVSDGGMGESVDSFNTENFTDSSNVGGDYMNDQVELYYDDLDVEAGFGGMDWDTGYPKHSYQTTVDYSLLVDRDDIIDDLLGMLPTKKDELADEFNAITDDEEALAFIETNFDKLVDAYYYDLKDRHRDEAQEEAEEEFAFNFDEDDYRYPERDYYDESVNIPKLLNGIDKRTDNKYDLLNLYECGVWDKDQKKYIAEMLVKRASPKALYSYMNEDVDIGDDEDWRIGLELYADNGKSYEVMTVLEEREVDGHDLAIVGALGNEASNADEEAYFVLLDSDIEWGPVDTAEEAFEWASDVQDGYYSDDEDDFDSDDDYTGYDESLVTEAPDMFGLPTDDELEVEYQKRKDRVARQREKAQAKYDSAKSLPVSKIIDKSSRSFTKDAAIKKALLDIGASYGLSIKQTFNNYYTTYSNMLTLVSMEKDDIPLYTVRAEVGFGVSTLDGKPYIEAHIRVGDYANHSDIVDLSVDPLDESITIGDLFELVSDKSKDIANKFDRIMKHAESLSSKDSDINKHYYRYEHGKDLNDLLSALYKEYKLEECSTPFNANGMKDYEEEWPDADDDIDFTDLYGAHGEYDDDYGVQKKHSMKEDTIKQGKHWVNKGKAGTHGKFATKKAADAQRKAMFANGYNGEALEEDAARVEPLNRNQDVEKLVFNDINAQLETLRPSYGYKGYYDRLKSYTAWTNDRDYWYLEDNYDYHKGYASAKQNLILHYNGYGSVEKERLKAIAQAIKNIGGKYIAIKYGNIYFYLDLAKYIEKDRQAKHQAKEARKEKLMSIDIEKYRPSDALIAKAKQYYLTNSTRFVRKIDDIDTYLTYYYLSQLLDWSDLLDVIRDKASSLNLSKYYDIEDAIDLKVKPEKIDRGNSGFVSNFRDVVKFCIDNKIQWKATNRRATSREYEKDTHNGAIYTIAYDFEVNGNVLPVAVHTDEGGGRPYGYMVNGAEVSGTRQAAALIIRWIKDVTNMED